MGDHFFTTEEFDLQIKLGEMTLKAEKLEKERNELLKTLQMCFNRLKIIDEKNSAERFIYIQIESILKKMEEK